MTTATLESPGARLFREALRAQHLEEAERLADMIALAKAGHDHVRRARYAGQLLDELVQLVAYS